MQTFSPYAILNRKRRGDDLAPEEIAGFIDGFTAGRIPDYQMSALLMAIAIQGLSAEETRALTAVMIESGEQWNLRSRFDFIADKHSTGGVGDKVSIVLAPWVASCGVKNGMLSGRGLGHTGGTLDKLESIPGFRARLSRQEFEKCIDDVGCVIATSTEGIAPADRKLYALRDVTGTVESIPLITASIMSKKLALGPSALLLDVKAGSGAFMRTLDDARALARSLIAAAKDSGTRVSAMITNMDQPLGTACGNVSEVLESLDVLRGAGPDDVRELTRAQAAAILEMSGRFDRESANEALDDSLASGRAFDQAMRWFAAQGVDPDVFHHPDRLPIPTTVIEVQAPRSGVIASMDAYAMGMLGVEIGIGRRQQDDEVDPAASILFDRKTGDEARAGEAIARIALGKIAKDPAALRAAYLAAIRITDNPPERKTLIYDRLDDTED
ncbi:MAG: thymidine phosphorylase [Acidobacteriota bacterium]